ncbi:MAG: tetratricopeptide repeat protein, partial [Acidobacteriota bacterium]
YNQKATELLAVQEKIAMEISENLRWQLSGEDQSQMMKQGTQTPEAYRSYLEGRYWWNKRNRDGFERAVELFNEAIEGDPLYAQAYAGLADTYTLLAYYYHRTPEDAFPLARAAAQRALEIDDSLAEVHTSLGFIKALYEWDWSAAEADFKRAIELNPNYPTAHHWYGAFLGTQGRLDEWLEETSKAQTLDPLSPQITSSVGSVFRQLGQYDEAIEQFQRALELNPELQAAHASLAWTYWEKGLHEEAIAQAERLASVNPDASIVAVILRSLASGNRAEAIAALRDSDQLPAWNKAMFSMFAGEEDLALEWLTQAVDERDPQVAYIKADPYYDTLRDDPRFQDLLRRMNLMP